LAVTGCQGGGLRHRLPLENDGEVFLYLQPLPREAEQLTFRLGAITATGVDGTEFPCSVILAEAGGRATGRQRLLGSCVLPAGDYEGLSFRAASASVQSETGRIALAVADPPARVDFKFTLARRQAAVISLAFKYGEAMEGGFRFLPTFAAFRPDRPPITAVGFVANSRSNTITLFDKRSLQVFDALAAGREPSGMALDQRTRRAYVALTGEDSIAVLDVLAGTLAERIRLAPGDEPRELALTPDGKVLLSANTASNMVSIIDTVSRVEVARVRVGNGPSSILVEPTGRQAFVLNTASSTISILDIPARTVIRTIAAESGPVRGQFNRRGDRLYVIHETSPYVLVVNPGTLAAVGRFLVRSSMDAIQVDPNTDLVYLGRKRDVIVGLYEPLSFAAIGFVDTGGGIAHMAVDGDTNALFLVCPETRSVLAASLIRKGKIGEFDVGDGPYWIAVMGER
jgi:YVTN family beta-propeller protein